MARTRIGTCSGPADASIVRSMLAAHDIDSFVSGEQHAAMLGGLGGALISLDIWVASEDADQASQLLREMRDSVVVDDSDEDADDTAMHDERVEVEKRKRFGVVLLLAFCVTFGTAHMYMGAWAIGLVLATIELAGITQLDAHPGIAATLLVGCIVADAIGAILRVRAIGRIELPRARTL